MTWNEITMRAATKTSNISKGASKNTSKAVPLALFFVLCTNLFFVSSAFSFGIRQCSHLRSIPSASGNYRKPLPTALSYGSIGDADNDVSAGLGASSSETPESSAAQSLPTSNDFMTPEEVVTTCMRHLQGEGYPTPSQERDGLEICYNFSSDSCRMANGGSLESFLQRANNPVFQTMVGCAKWEVVNVGPEIAGTPTRGAMQTVLVDVVPRLADGGAERNDRQFLWTIVKERRPPRQGHCLVHECVAVENAFAHTL